MQHLGFAIKIHADGFRAVLGGAEEDAAAYLAALKSGVIHWSSNRALLRDDAKAKHYDYQSSRTL